MPDRPGVGTRVALVGVTVLALLAVVALASRGGLGGDAVGGASPSASLLDWSFSIFLVAYVLTIPFVVYALWFRRRTLARGPKQPRRWTANVVGFLLFLALALAISKLRDSRGALEGVKAPPAIGSNRRTTTAIDLTREPRFQWPVVVVTALLALAAFAAWYRLRRRRSAGRAPLLVGEELAHALDDAIDDVRAEQDPRRAVIKAYARLEAILGAHGLPRDPAEAPYEYLGRTLRRLDASAASVSGLTALFERAKFSLHEIGPELREQAIDALVAVRDELRAAAAEPEAVPAE